jgi:hypothetical protein
VVHPLPGGQQVRVKKRQLKVHQRPQVSLLQRNHLPGVPEEQVRAGAVQSLLKAVPVKDK